MNFPFDFDFFDSSGVGWKSKYSKDIISSVIQYRVILNFGAIEFGVFLTAENNDIGW